MFYYDCLVLNMYKMHAHILVLFLVYNTIQITMYKVVMPSDVNTATVKSKKCLIVFYLILGIQISFMRHLHLPWTPWHNFVLIFRTLFGNHTWLRTDWNKSVRTPCGNCTEIIQYQFSHREFSTSFQLNGI